MGDDLGSLFAAGVAPPAEIRSLRSWASMVRLGDTPEAMQGGQRRPIPFRPTPAQAEILDAIDDPAYPRVAVLGPVQRGKSLAAMHVPIAWCLAELRAPCLLAAPRAEDAASVHWQAKTRPLLIDSGYQDVLPADGAGSKTGTPDSILASTGARLYLRGAGGVNEAAQAGFSVRLVVVTEVDSIAISARRAKRRPGEGDPARRRIELFAARAISYGDQAKIILESTLKDDRDSLILALVSDGSGGVLHHPCPHCRAYAPRSWSQVAYDATDARSAYDSARIACPSCGVLLTAEEASDASWRALVVHRGQRIEGGLVVGPMPRCSARSLRWAAYDDPLAHLGSICREHWDATRALVERGDHEPLRQFTRDHLVAPYVPDDGSAQRLQIPAVAVAQRSAAATYERGTMPFPGLVTVGVDWQEREAWWIALATDADRAAVIDAGVDYLCHRHEQPTPDQRRSVCEAIQARALAGWPLATGGGLVPAAGVIVDLGGRGWLDVLEGWMREHRWSWWGARGDSRRDAGDGSADHAAPGWYARYDRADGRRLLLADAAITGRVLDGLAAPIGSPVALQVPRGLAATDHLARQLTAEAREQGPDGQPRYLRVYHHNHLGDAAKYAWALGRYLRDHPRPAAGSAPLAWLGGRR